MHLEPTRRFFFWRMCFLREQRDVVAIKIVQELSCASPNAGAELWDSGRQPIFRIQTGAPKQNVDCVTQGHVVPVLGAVRRRYYRRGSALHDLSCHGS